MARRNRHGGHTLLSRTLWLLLLVTAAVGEGCASSPPPIVIHDSAKASVYLEPLHGSGAPASHPMSLGSPTLARVVAGLRVQQQEGLLQTLLAGTPKKEAVFARDEVQFLAPLLDAALTRASSHQAVRFHTLRTNDLGTQRSGGTLYVKDQAVYLTLTEFRVTSGGTHVLTKAGRRGRDATGLRQKTVLFVPEGVERTDAAPPRAVDGPPHLKTFVIDYALLAKLANIAPESASLSRARGVQTRSPTKDQAHGTDRDLGRPVGAPDGTTEPDAAESLKDLIIKKDLEIEALREDVRSLRRRLDDSR